MQKVDLKSMTFAELQQFVEDLGEKKFRTTQLYQWMHQKMVKEFASMTNLSAAFRDKLEEQAALNGCTMVKRQISADGTNKFLMELSDGNKVESVLMKYHHGNSVCHLSYMDITWERLSSCRTRMRGVGACHRMSMRVRTRHSHGCDGRHRTRCALGHSRQGRHGSGTSCQSGYSPD